MKLEEIKQLFDSLYLQIAEDQREIECLRENNRFLMKRMVEFEREHQRQRQLASPRLSDHQPITTTE
jgi:hypothetical protein